MSMKVSKIAPYIFLSVIILGCSVSRIKPEAVADEKTSSLLETQYYKIFSDATKHALFGNYRAAIPLYNTCIKEFPDRPASYFQLSSIYLKTNNIQQALEFGQKAVELDPSNEWYLMQLANIYQFTGNLVKATEYSEMALKVRDDDQIRYNLAMLYNKTGRNEDAISILNTIRGQNAESREVILMKHNIFHSMREYDSAVYELEKLTSLFPEEVESWGMLAEYLAEIGRISYARNIFKDIIEKDLNNGIANLSFGEFYMKENKMDSAFFWFGKAMESQDLNINDKIGFIAGFFNDKDFLKSNYETLDSLLNKIGARERKFIFYAAKIDLYLNADQILKAKPYMDSALIYEKKTYELWEQALMINTFLKDYNSVIRIATECLQYFKEKGEVYFFRANAYRNENFNDSALMDVDTTLAKFSDNRDLYVQSYNLAAEIYRERKAYEKSDSCFEAIIEFDPENLIIRNNYAYYLSLRGEKLVLAENLSRYTLEKDGENATFLDTYGWIQYMKGNYASAKQYIERSIRNGAYNNAEVVEHYGDIMVKLNKCKDAMEAYEKAFALEESETLREKMEFTRNECK